MKDCYLKKQLVNNPKKYHLEQIKGSHVITTNGKIYVPKRLRQRILSWYHHYLCHPGSTRTEQTLRQCFTWPRLTEDAKKHVKYCKTCQQFKKQHKKYGKLPPKDAEAIPWQEVCVDFEDPIRSLQKLDRCIYRQ